MHRRQKLVFVNIAFISILVIPLVNYSIVNAKCCVFLDSNKRNFHHINNGINQEILDSSNGIQNPSDIDLTRNNLNQFFVENKGQFDEEILFSATIKEISIGFTTSQIIYCTSDGNFTITFKESNLVQPLGKGRYSSFSNYYFGKTMISGIEHFSEIIFENLYEGIDLVYYFTQQGLKYDFIVEPHSHLKSISMVYSGLDNLVCEKNSLLFRKESITIQDTNLQAWYEDSHEKLDLSFQVTNSLILNQGDFEVKFVTSKNYDSSRKIVIDPLICLYSTFFGGSDLEYPTVGADNQQRDLVIDEFGNYIFAGGTSSTDYPISSGAFQSSIGGLFDAVITKMAPDGQTLLFSTFIGGSDPDWITDIAVHSNGDIALLGVTESFNFPTLNAIQDTYSDGPDDEPTDIFLAKLDENGTLLFSTFWGGTDEDWGSEVTFDNLGNIVIVGAVESPDMYTKNAHQVSLNGTTTDSCIVKFSNNGQSVVFSTYFGGDGDDSMNCVVIDSNNDILIAGDVQGTNFPTLNAYQTDVTGLTATVFAKFSPSGVLKFASTIDGVGIESAYSIALDSQDNFILAGSTTSIDFPVENATQPTIGGALDIFITKMSADGQTLLFSTFLGGSGGDECSELILDLNGNYLLTGHTASSNFPLKHAYQHTYLGKYDAIVSLVDRNSTLISSSYLGGSEQDQAADISIDLENNIVILGVTQSSNFPTCNAFKSALTGTNDVFIIKFELDLSLPDITPSETTSPTANGELSFLSLITIFSIFALLGASISKMKSKI